MAAVQAVPTAAVQMVLTAAVQMVPTAAVQMVLTAAVQMVPTAAVQMAPTVAVQVAPTAAVQMAPTVAVQMVPTAAVQVALTAAVQVVPTAAVQVALTAAIQMVPIAAVQVVPIAAIQMVPIAAVQAAPTAAAQMVPTAAVQMVPTVAVQMVLTVAAQVALTAAVQVAPTAAPTAAVPAVLVAPLRHNGKAMGENMKKLLILVFSVIFVYSGWRVYVYQREAERSMEIYSQLEAYAHVSTDEKEETELPQVDFAALGDVNEDIVAWLYGEGTVLNYPVVKGEDNSYYLSHLFDGSDNASGCLFLDSRNSSDFSDDNTIIYGHNMKNGTMFAFINQYQEQSYYDQHPSMFLLTPNGNFEVHLFAGFLEDVNGNAWQRAFQNENEKIKWLEEARNASTFVSDTIPSKEDKIVTFSTCSNASEDVRYVLMGVLKDVSK